MQESIDIFPIRSSAGDASILSEIKNGEVVYESGTFLKKEKGSIDLSPF